MAEPRDASGLQPQVVGGREAVRNGFPWMVGLVDAADPIVYRGFQCGGVLVHPEWVLTAAHCVEDRSVSDLEVLVGAHSLLSNEEGVRVSITEIQIHPLYHRRPGSVGFDLALLRLSRAQSVAPLALGAGQASGMVKALGWGRTAAGGFRSFSLQEVDMPLVPHSAVDAEAVYGEALTPDILLAGVESGGLDTCDGDSGGPLVSWDPRRARWQLWAVTAGGSERGCAARGAYGLYTAVRPHLGWLESHVVREFEDWESLYEVGALEADPDGDGFSNWDEYASVTHPLLADSRPRLAYRLSVSGTQRFPVIGGVLRIGTQDVEYWVEHTSDFARWTALARLESEGAVSPGRPAAQSVWRSPAALSDSAPAFFRIRAVSLKSGERPPGGLQLTSR